MDKLLTVMAAMVLFFATALADKTTRRPLRVDPEAFTDLSANTADEDTLTNITDQIAVSGYDKPLRATGESFFITNNSATSISGLEVTIEYLDMSRRQLHKRSVRIDTNVPSGETRRVDINSWDRRQTFYYSKGIVPRTGNVTPYDVSITVDRLFVGRH